MTTYLTILGAIAAGLIVLAPPQASAQGFGSDIDETAGGGMEEAAALYFAAPPTEEAEAAVTADRVAGAGAVQLAISLGQVEEALDACRDLRFDMQELIGDTYGSYSVNPGWLRRYQACVLQRTDEAKLLGRAIKARQTELISRLGAEDDEAAAAEAMRAADLMARLAARQSAVRLAIAREGRKQRAFVQYYNTGEFQEELRETQPAPQVRAPAEGRALDGAAPIGTSPDEPDDLPLELESNPNAVIPPSGGAILLEGETIEGAEEPASAGGGTDDADLGPMPDEQAITPRATGAPLPLHGTN